MSDKKDDLQTALGGLRRKRIDNSVENQPELPAPSETIERRKRPPKFKPKEEDAREPFTTRLRPSQRRWLRRWAGDLEEEVQYRVTLEDLVEALLTEAMSSETLQKKIAKQVVKK